MRRIELRQIADSPVATPALMRPVVLCDCVAGIVEHKEVPANVVRCDRLSLAGSTRGSSGRQGGLESRNQDGCPGPRPRGL